MFAFSIFLQKVNISSIRIVSHSLTQSRRRFSGADLFDVAAYTINAIYNFSWRVDLVRLFLALHSAPRYTV